MSVPIEDQPVEPEPEKRRRPEWLVGAEEGFHSEFQPGAAAPEAGAPAPDAGPAPDARPRPVLTRPDAGMPQPRSTLLPDLDAPQVQGGWVARSEITSELKPRPDPLPFPARDPFPSSAPGAQEIPAVRVAAGVAEGPDVGPEIHARPDRTSALADGLVALFRRAWKPVAAVAIAVFLAITLGQAIGIGTTPIRRILEDPARYDGRQVRVRGHVSEDVFAVGGGYSFYLLQGRDSLVVFTRFRLPQPRQGISLDAQVSAGRLGNELRPALLEVAPQK